MSLVRAAPKLVAVALLAASLAAPAAASDSATTNLLSLINAYRAASGVAPLAADRTLDTVARRHGEDMATRAYFAHVTPEGGDLGHRLWNAGYRFAVAAENLARGYHDAVEVLAGWQGSPGHKANLLRDDVSQVGIGMIAPADSTVATTSGSPVWVLVLARPQRR